MIIMQLPIWNFPPGCRHSMCVYMFAQNSFRCVRVIALGQWFIMLLALLSAVSFFLFFFNFLHAVFSFYLEKNINSQSWTCLLLSAERVVHGLLYARTNHSLFYTSNQQLYYIPHLEELFQHLLLIRNCCCCCWCCRWWPTLELTPFGMLAIFQFSLRSHVCIILKRPFSTFIFIFDPCCSVSRQVVRFSLCVCWTHFIFSFSPVP